MHRLRVKGAFGMHHVLGGIIRVTVLAFGSILTVFATQPPGASADDLHDDPTGELTQVEWELMANVQNRCDFESEFDPRIRPEDCRTMALLALRAEGEGIMEICLDRLMLGVGMPLDARARHCDRIADIQNRRAKQEPEWAALEGERQGAELSFRSLCTEQWPGLSTITCAEILDEMISNSLSGFSTCLEDSRWRGLLATERFQQSVCAWHYPRVVESLGASWSKFCERNSLGEFCGTLTRRPDGTWEAEWQNGAKARFTVTQVGGSVTLIRNPDTAGPSRGLTATYKGTIQPGRTVNGTVTWGGSGSPVAGQSGTWSATIEP